MKRFVLYFLKMFVLMQWCHTFYLLVFIIVQNARIYRVLQSNCYVGVGFSDSVTERLIQDLADAFFIQKEEKTFERQIT